MPINEIRDDGDHENALLAQTFPADPETVKIVMEADVESIDGRSEWQWMILANGDVMLGVFPRGDTYFATEVQRDADWTKALNKRGGNTHD